jgi:putative FmdB family regulatory protein
MPIYVYRCERCGEETEVVRSMSGPPLQRCPHCKSTKLKRVFQAIGIAFKGSGFHKTDYASPKKSSDEAKPSERKADAKPSETKTEAKKNTKTETKTSKKSE